MKAEITRLETKLSAASSPPSPSKPSSLSPSRHSPSSSSRLPGSPSPSPGPSLKGSLAAEVVDPELMKEINRAITDRLKQMWGQAD